MWQTVATGSGRREGGRVGVAPLTGSDWLVWDLPLVIFLVRLWSSFARSRSALLSVLIIGTVLAVHQVPGASAEQEQHTFCCAFLSPGLCFSPE